MGESGSDKNAEKTKEKGPSGEARVSLFPLGGGCVGAEAQT